MAVFFLGDHLVERLNVGRAGGLRGDVGLLRLGGKFRLGREIIGQRGEFFGNDPLGEREHYVVFIADGRGIDDAGLLRLGFPRESSA